MQKFHSISSEEVEIRARKILSNSSISELRQLKIKEIDGELCLLGALPSWYHKQLAQELIRKLSPLPIPISNQTAVKPLFPPGTLW